MSRFFHMFDFFIDKSDAFKNNKVYLVKDNYKEAFICLDTGLKSETVEYFKKGKGTGKIF
ncbi:MAG: hypothetical protein QG657_4424 [Acidobacteriota bacterium]|nr:hypothetical protein [Acidobacteriota bacterium]